MRLRPRRIRRIIMPPEDQCRDETRQKRHTEKNAESRPCEPRPLEKGQDAAGRQRCQQHGQRQYAAAAAPVVAACRAGHHFPHHARPDRRGRHVEHHPQGRKQNQGRDGRGPEQQRNEEYREKHKGMQHDQRDNQVAAAAQPVGPVRTDHLRERAQQRGHRRQQPDGPASRPEENRKRRKIHVSESGHDGPEGAVPHGKFQRPTPGRFHIRRGGFCPKLLHCRRRYFSRADSQIKLTQAVRNFWTPAETAPSLRA